MGFWRAVKTGVTAAVGTMLKPGRYRAAGLAITCQHCKHDVFDESSVTLPEMFAFTSGTPVLTRVLACTRCRMVHWFLAPPERTETVA